MDGARCLRVDGPISGGAQRRPGGDGGGPDPDPGHGGGRPGGPRRPRNSPFYPLSPPGSPSVDGHESRGPDRVGGRAGACVHGPWMAAPHPRRPGIAVTAPHLPRVHRPVDDVGGVAREGQPQAVELVLRPAPRDPSRPLRHHWPGLGPGPGPGSRKG